MQSPVPAEASAASVIERVIALGDLSRLTPEQRVRYYLEVCSALELDPRLKPFEYLMYQGRLTLYATRAATDQLRARRGISVEIVGREVIDGSIYVVTARATSPDGRRDEAIGAVSIEGLKGDALANAIMRAETKAKWRVTLSLCGLGMADESEVASIPDARVVAVDAATGEIQGALPAEAGGGPTEEELRRLGELLRQAGLTKADLVAFLDACGTSGSATERLRAWWSMVPEPSLEQLVEAVRRYKTEASDDVGEAV